jgi:hypothetical protein
MALKLQHGFEIVFLTSFMNLVILWFLQALQKSLKSIHIETLWAWHYVAYVIIDFGRNIVIRDINGQNSKCKFVLKDAP